MTTQCTELIKQSSHHEKSTSKYVEEGRDQRQFLFTLSTNPMGEMMSAKVGDNQTLFVRAMVLTNVDSHVHQLGNTSESEMTHMRAGSQLSFAHDQYARNTMSKIWPKISDKRRSKAIIFLLRVQISMKKRRIY